MSSVGEVPLVVRGGKGQSLGGGVGGKDHLGGHRRSRVPVVSPQEVLGVIHPDVDGQRLGRVSSGAGESEGSRPALGDGRRTGREADQVGTGGGVIYLDAGCVGIAGLVARAGDCLDLRVQGVGCGFSNPIHVGIDAEGLDGFPGTEGYVVIPATGVDAEADLPVVLQGLHPDGDRITHGAALPGQGVSNLVSFVDGCTVSLELYVSGGCPRVGRVDDRVAVRGPDAPVLKLQIRGELIAVEVFHGQDTGPVSPVAFRKAVLCDCDGLLSLVLRVGQGYCVVHEGAAGTRDPRSSRPGRGRPRSGLSRP